MPLDHIDPIADTRWDALVRSRPSSVFHSPAWLRVLRDTYDFDLRALILSDKSGESTAGIAYCSIDDMMDPRIVSLPFSDFCDPLVGDRASWSLLVETLLEQDHRLSMRCLHNDLPLRDERLSTTYRARWHCVDLQRSADAVWDSLDGSARRAIRKARAKGVEVHIADDKADLRAFFLLHLGVRKYKYNLLAQPYRFFERIWDHFLAQGDGALMLASHEGQVIGGVLFLEWQNKLYYKFNASDPDQIALRPNDLVVWEGIKYGIGKGHTYLDFGLSDWDQEGLLRYKRKYASEEKTISFLSYAPPDSPSPAEKQMRTLLPQITDLFVAESVPDEVSEKAGDILYRYFT
ncbi:MAG TPA: GNAT family N-acetyltransferase [Candidatus Binatia bacterium]|nr:GNAT family N-acetyltransferase [Candidatus Binatia bacterium]